MVSLGNTGLDVEKLFIYLSGMKKTLFILMAIALMAPSCKKCYTCQPMQYVNGSLYSTKPVDPSAFAPGEADVHDVCGSDKGSWQGKSIMDDTIANNHMQVIYQCYDK